MKTHIIEATNGPNNWGKFMLMVPDAEWARTPAAPGCESPVSLLQQRGWNRDSDLIVFDLQTREGAAFSLQASSPHQALEKHRIWVCPLFEPFLTWLYEQPAAKVLGLDLPPHVDLPDAVFAFAGHRRSGPEASDVPIVHGLYQGRTLCGRFSGPPSAWPKGHLWARYDEPPKITCDTCLSVGAGEMP